MAEFRRIADFGPVSVGEFDCCGTPTETEVEAAPYPEIVLPRTGAYLREDAAGAVFLDRRR